MSIPNHEVVIAPSILAADFTQLGAQVQAAELAGAQWLHIDVMDGRFVPNITMGPLVVRALRPITSLPLDVHLMIVEPERYVDAFADAGADHITVHLEASPHLHRTLQQIHEAGCKAGVAINPHTPARDLNTIINYVDIINVMTVNPGFGGQEFISESTEKIQMLRTMTLQAQRDIFIEVDGGINSITARRVVAAGGNVLVAGTAVFGHSDGIGGGIAALRAALP